MAIQNVPNDNQGRKVVRTKEIRPDSNGRITVFRTEILEHELPVSPDLEQDLLENASSEAMRRILGRSIAEARGQQSQDENK